jgi:hypothetical protein
MGTRGLERDDVATWVLKANPDIYDVEAALEVGAFDEWRLAPSYRLELISVGDPCLLWVTGEDRGFCGAGEVTDLPVVGQGGTEYWRDLREKMKVRPYLPVDMRPIPKIREDELLSDPRFGEPEIIRVRQASNPSYLNASQFEVVTTLMGK